MRLSVQHDTIYDYRSAVETAQHTAHLQPRQTALQSLLGFALQVSPTPEGLRHGQDAFGNPQAWWTLVQPHTQLRVVACSTVQTSPPLDLQGTQPWEAVREHFRYRSGQPGDAQTCFVFGSHHAPLHEQFAVYARASFTPGRPLQDAAIALMRQIHKDFSYASQSTDVHTPALDALQARRGVCQDFAHILIAGLRSLGLAARYVSGYLLTHPPEGQPRLIGADASHAWASVYLPELASSPCGGWLDLDPTNDLVPAQAHVRVAAGRDFGDVTPLRGVIRGGGRHTLTVGVTTREARRGDDLGRPRSPAR